MHRGLHRPRTTRWRWRGETRRFGEGAAILVGDFALRLRRRAVRHRAPDGPGVFDELRIELSVGQYLDLVGTASASTDPVQAAQRIARYKSGKYTVERPLHLGAALAGRLDELAGPAAAQSASRSARRSSSATTCSACSATRPSPASRWATTCARASPRRSSPRRSPAPRRRSRACSSTSARRRRLTADDVARAPGGPRRRPARSPRSSGPSSTDWSTRRSPRSTPRRSPATPGSRSKELATFVAWRDR